MNLIKEHVKDLVSSLLEKNSGKWKNPATGRMVGYERAKQLDIVMQIKPKGENEEEENKKLGAKYKVRGDKVKKYQDLVAHESPESIKKKLKATNAQIDSLHKDLETGNYEKYKGGKDGLFKAMQDQNELAFAYKTLPRK